MLTYALRRIAIMIPTLVLISVVTFIVIQLPPGDFLSLYAQTLREDLGTIDVSDELQALSVRYGLDQPMYVQYWKWISGIIRRGDWGHSMGWNKPVKELIWERLGLTIVLSASTMLFSWCVAIPLGVYSATHKYSILDYVVTSISFIGRGMPNFLLALLVLWFAMSKLGINVGGLFSEEYIMAPWSPAKVLDMLKHIWIPLVILGVGNSAGLIRITRNNLLDELNKPYVTTARAKGLSEQRLLWKYPVRVALNPFFATIGWSLANLIGGSIIVAQVLNLQTTGPMMLAALVRQDMYLAGSFLLMLSVLSVIGTLFQDILLAWVDPRIRFD